MEFWLKPIYIKFRVRTLLIVLVILALIITGVVLYQNYVFHNLFFRNLTAAKVESVSVYHYAYEPKSVTLSEQEAEEVLALLRNIRLCEEPYKEFGINGGFPPTYRIQMKNGRSFELQAAVVGEHSVYILDEDAYNVGSYFDDAAADKVENILHLEELYNKYIEKYFQPPK